MNTPQFQIVTPNDLPDYRHQANDIATASWPEFMLHDSVSDENWHELFDRFGEYQFAMFDTANNCMAAMGNSLPFDWEQPIEELSEGGWDWVFLKAIEDHKKGIEPNTQSAIQVAIRPEYQGMGLSAKMIQAIRNIGKSKGFKNLVAPVRPSEKSKYPLTSIDDYITWKSNDGLPFDAWLRVHVRAGARIVKACHESMIIKGTRTDWESWTDMKFPQSGTYFVPGALNPISMNTEKDEGIYIEPNVWMVHPLV